MPASRSLEDDMLDTFSKAAGQRNERAFSEPFGSQDRDLLLGISVWPFAAHCA